MLRMKRLQSARHHEYVAINKQNISCSTGFPELMQGEYGTQGVIHQSEDIALEKINHTWVEHLTCPFQYLMRPMLCRVVMMSSVERTTYHGHVCKTWDCTRLKDMSRRERE
jgi:hypothetical protein